MWLHFQYQTVHTYIALLKWLENFSWIRCLLRSPVSFLWKREPIEKDIYRPSNKHRAVVEEKPLARQHAKRNLEKRDAEKQMQWFYMIYNLAHQEGVIKLTRIDTVTVDLNCAWTVLRNKDGDTTCKKCEQETRSKQKIKYWISAEIVVRSITEKQKYLKSEFEKHSLEKTL